MNNIPLWRKVIYTIIAPFYIFVWSIFNIKKVWAEAKRSACTSDCNQGRNCICRNKE